MNPFNDIEIFQSKYITISTGLVVQDNGLLRSLPLGIYKVKVLRYSVNGSFTGGSSVFTGRLLDPIDVKMALELSTSESISGIFVAFSNSNVLTLEGEGDLYEQKEVDSCSVYDFWSAKEDKDFLGKLDKNKTYIITNIPKKEKP